jgi:MOSC domain-containing protein YiiM
MVEARVVSLNLGQCAHFEVSDGGVLESAIRKQPQTGPVWLGAEGLAGDEVSPDPAHGGPNRALHVFATESYRVFEERAGHSLPVPTFGENLTISGYDETIARVGDVLQIGGARVQVSMPTERCDKPGRLVGVPRLLKWILETLRTGFYLRVVEPGEIARDDVCVRVEEGPAAWTIRALNELMFRRIEAEAELRALRQLEVLAPEWRRRLGVHFERRTGRSLPEF